MVLLGETFPNFRASTNAGSIDFHEWLDNSWAILFSHPNDFTPVCTTELARVMKLMPEFDKLGVKVIAMSCNSVESHIKWIEDIKNYAGISMNGFPYPIIEDESRTIATKLGMLDPTELDKDGIPLAARAVFIIDPKKTMRLSILYPATTGRNFDIQGTAYHFDLVVNPLYLLNFAHDFLYYCPNSKKSEIIRVIESLQLTDAYKVATPVDWKKGDDVMVQPTLSTDEAKKLFTENIKTLNVPSGKQYMRLVPHPVEALSKK